jgi:hypothetical protein
VPAIAASAPSDCEGKQSPLPLPCHHCVGGEASSDSPLQLHSRARQCAGAPSPSGGSSRSWRYYKRQHCSRHMPVEAVEALLRCVHLRLIVYRILRAYPPIPPQHFVRVGRGHAVIVLSWRLGTHSMLAFAVAGYDGAFSHLLAATARGTEPVAHAKGVIAHRTQATRATTTTSASVLIVVNMGAALEELALALGSMRAGDAKKIHVSITTTAAGMVRAVLAAQATLVPATASTAAPHVRTTHAIVTQVYAAAMALAKSVAQATLVPATASTAAPHVRTTHAIVTQVYVAAMALAKSVAQATLVPATASTAAPHVRTTHAIVTQVYAAAMALAKSVAQATLVPATASTAAPHVRTTHAIVTQVYAAAMALAKCLLVGAATPAIAILATPTQPAAPQRYAAPPCRRQTRPVALRGTTGTHRTRVPSAATRATSQAKRQQSVGPVGRTATGKVAPRAIRFSAAQSRRMPAWVASKLITTLTARERAQPNVTAGSRSPVTWVGTRQLPSTAALMGISRPVLLGTLSWHR